jgi:endonuclease-3
LEKRPFDIEVALTRVAEAIREFPPAALFALAAAGHDTLFEVLVACILSIRTRDEVMLPTAQQLFALARTPEAMARLTPASIDTAISLCTYHEAKAAQIHAIAHRILAEMPEGLPCDREVLLSFSGVGPKCAGLALGIACGQPHLGVDIHVHRVVNRWGYVRARTPEATLAALEKELPRRHWIELNRLVMPFGKHICTGERPRCSTCPLLDLCPQIGVDAHR